MRIIRNRLLPVGKAYGAINLFGLLFVKPGVELNPVLFNHERIHSMQMRELLWIPFYLIYIAEWVWHLIRERGNTYKAYRAISFEREAYSHEEDLSYLKHRHPYSQWKK